MGKWQNIRVDSGAQQPVVEIQLASPPGNILDSTMVTELREALALAARPTCRAVVLSGAGEHFSYGASVQEHLPVPMRSYLPAFHALVLQAAELPVPIFAAISGRCLGGGLELALVSHAIFAAPGAQLGQPEIRLGVIAPVASILLPLRVGQAVAEDLLLTGRTMTAEEACALGLIQHLAADPRAAARAAASTYAQSGSATSARMALKAARLGWLQVLRRDLPTLEQWYLDQLLETPDALEGIRAFLEKRPPQFGASDEP